MLFWQVLWGVRRTTNGRMTGQARLLGCCVQLRIQDVLIVQYAEEQGLCFIARATRMRATCGHRPRKAKKQKHAVQKQVADIILSLLRTRQSF